MKATSAAVLKAAQERLWDAERRLAKLALAGAEVSRAEGTVIERRREIERFGREASEERGKAAVALRLLAVAEFETDSESVNQSTPSGGAL